MGRCLSGICGTKGEKQNPSLDKDKHIHHCITLVKDNGSIEYYDRDHSDVLVAKTLPSFEYSDVVDHRQPPYFQILPCPFCGVLSDKDHDLSLHVNKKLGTSHG
jgi:hypothetical protein